MLNANGLETDLVNAFSSSTDRFDVAAKKLANAYAKYAIGGTSCAGGNPSQAQIDAAEAILAGQLMTILSTGKELYSTLTQMSNVFAAFWLAPPILFIASGPVPPGAITVPPVPAGLFASLSAGLSPILPGILAVPPIPVSPSQIASIWANSLHLFTSLIVVTHPIVPTPCVAPIF